VRRQTWPSAASRGTFGYLFIAVSAANRGTFPETISAVIGLHFYRLAE
jgi:hypothetical protein